MARRFIAIVGVLAVSVLGMVSTSAAEPPAKHGFDWRGDAAMISNFGLHRSGEFIYQDYLYDDHGPNTDGVNHTDAPLGFGARPGDPSNPRTGSSGGQIRHAGDFMYGANSNGYYYNVADLIEFRVKRDKSNLLYLFRLGALDREDAAVVGMCVDQDRRTETGLVTWPFKAGLSEALGCDNHYTVYGTGTAVTDASGRTVDLAELGGETIVDLDANTIQVRVPLEVADPGEGRWRYYVASGLWNTDAHSWYQVPVTPSNPGSPVPTGGGADVPQIWDLLSNNNEPNTYWREERQADDLRVGKIAEHFVDVSFRRLANMHDDADPELTGVVDRIYVADHAMEPNEGIRFTAVALGPRNYIYYGNYQPYAVVIPSTYYEQRRHDPRAAFPFDQCLHPLNGNHHVEIYYAQAEAERNYVAGVTGTTSHTGYLGFSEYQSQIDRQNLVYACGVGRGEGVGFAGGNGMVDALEVAEDVKARYAIDEDQHTLHGISLGAIGTWYMSTLYPDRYSAALPSIFTGSTGHLTNLYNVPTFYTIGTFDQFAQGVRAGDQVADSMTALGNEFLYYRHLARFHELSLGNEGNPFAEPLFYSRKRVRNPATVKFIHDARRYNEKIPGDNSVYWVSQLQQRDEAAQARIDITTLGRADELPTDQVVFDGIYENTREGYQARMRGLLRMSPEEFAEVWRPEQFQDGWRQITLDVQHTELEQPEVTNGFSMTTKNLASAAVDLERMKLDAQRTITGAVQGDGALTIALLGKFSGTPVVTLDGVAVPVDRTSQGVTFQLQLNGEPQTLTVN